MNKFTAVAATCLFSLMTTASQADEMMPEEGMMEDDMHESIDESDMKREGMSDSMEMESDMEMNSDMEDDMDTEDEMDMDEEMESESM
ncbi:hypothetical protein EKK97_16155 [Billgrantia tianxiuensis]|uniref:Pentapeptide MXKDX repeat protein n=1 Tax=Billgrantia tianxiuensis TaxID=2497861 RepID=A0A6I6SNM2_9GAMM|nr:MULTISPECIES: hypothetical protein [Halomonas]MCE8034414.1 hypothetical protein [Halomonas sp. MCCC 1A11057]QHC50801.1 hypothetical protein EKK97_16155 [Halomonas tianxiuensis]